MDTILLDRSTSMDTLFSFMGDAECVRASRVADRVVLTPATKADGRPVGYPDPADYDDETDYICAVPGLADRITASMKTPPSEWKDVPEECFNV